MKTDTNATLRALALFLAATVGTGCAAEASDLAPGPDEPSEGAASDDEFSEENAAAQFQYLYHGEIRAGQTPNFYKIPKCIDAESRWLLRAVRNGTPETFSGYACGGIARTGYRPCNALARQTRGLLPGAPASGVCYATYTNFSGSIGNPPVRDVKHVYRLVPIRAGAKSTPAATRKYRWEGWWQDRSAASQPGLEVRLPRCPDAVGGFLTATPGDWNNDTSPGRFNGAVCGRRASQPVEHEEVATPVASQCDLIAATTRQNRVPDSIQTCWAWKHTIQGNVGGSVRYAVFKVQ